MELMLGGVTVNLIFLGASHSDNLIQVHVPQEKVLVGIDIAKGKSLFPDYRDMDVHSMLKVLKVLEHMPDVDIVLPGHGPIVDQENFGHQRRYIQALRDEVLSGIVAGDSLQQMRDTITMAIDDGLPVGLEFLGRAWDEATLFKLAYAYEQATHHRRPPEATPPLTNH